MTNQERIKKYLVDEDGYLKSDISNGKVIMLSGVWGSGKTHFWQNEIATNELKEELKNKREVYSYISLYGKTSIEEIENDIFSQAYSSAIGGENFITKGFSTFTKRMKRFGSSKIAKGLKQEQEDNIERTALERLNNGGIICFDDFERKSKEIDLNDLFGFITQLTINFQCKVVIILNDDVFEGKEKDIFSNVKEKTVSKFLNYNPKIKELFNLIFKDDKYKSLEEYKDLILVTINETRELNARVYIQVLDNLVEYIDGKQNVSNKYIIFLILTNINFILNHNIFEVYLEDKIITKYDPLESLPIIEKIDEYLQIRIKTVSEINQFLEKNIKQEFYNYIEYKIPFLENENQKIKNFMDENTSLFRSKRFLNNHIQLIKFESNNKAEMEFFNKISNFIETGILIKDD